MAENAADSGNTFKTVLAVLGGLMYLVSPIDLMPEAFLGPLGLADDLVVGITTMLYVLKPVRMNLFSFIGGLGSKLKTGLMVLAAAVYVASPVDLIPEAYFGKLGLADDLVVAIITLIYVLRKSPGPNLNS